MPLINYNNGPDVASLRGGRHGKVCIIHCKILFPSLLHFIRSYPYVDITPYPGFSICIPGSGSICIPDSIRRLPVRAMQSCPNQLVSWIHPPLCRAFSTLAPCYLGSISLLNILQAGDTPPPPPNESIFNRYVGSSTPFLIKLGG